MLGWHIQFGHAAIFRGIPDKFIVLPFLFAVAASPRQVDKQRARESKWRSYLIALICKRGTHGHYFAQVLLNLIDTYVFQPNVRREDLVLKVLRG